MCGCFATCGSAGAWIFGGFPGIAYLCQHADAVVVAAGNRPKLTSEPVDAPYANLELRILRSLKGPLTEGTTISANFRYLAHLPWLNDWTTSETPALNRMAQQLVAKGDVAASPVLIFLEHSAGVTVGTGARAHPLNNNEWVSMNYEGSILPLCREMDLTTKSSVTVTSQVETLLERAVTSCARDE